MRSGFRNFVAISSMLLRNLDNANDTGYRRCGLQLQLDPPPPESEGIRGSHHRTFTEADLLHWPKVIAMHSRDIRKGTYIKRFKQVWDAQKIYTRLFFSLY